MFSSPKHRGRIQAQGGGVEESEKWALEKPPTWQEGISMLNNLEEKLSPREQENRQELFDKAEDYIKAVGEKGGVDAQVSKTFLKKGSRDVRIDIEVILGTAFISLLCLFILIFWQ